MEQIIKFGISNYLQLCVEAGFSQIQSHITISMLMKHHIMIRCSITVLIDCQIDMYRRSLVFACAMYAHACASICVCGYVCAQMTRVCQDIPHHMSGTFNKP